MDKFRNTFALLSTNPKLTTNIKIIVDSNNNIYLESFNANQELTNYKYKGFKVNYNSSYDRDVYRFYNEGKFPKSIAYSVYKELVDESISNDYSKQYEMFYKAGASYLDSELYSENISLFAPIWIGNTDIPKYFVIFKTKEPVSKNTKFADTENDYYDYLRDPNYFIENILNKSYIIKTFSLQEDSNIGQYLRNTINKESRTSSGLYFNMNKKEASIWQGISYAYGGYTQKAEYIDRNIFENDLTITEFDYYINKGFERNEIIHPNIFNLEFLFDDNDSNEYEIHRYFGLYVDDISEGKVYIDINNFYKYNTIDKNNNITPDKFKNYNNDIILINNNGVNLYYDSYTSDTDLPTKQSDNNNLVSFYYLKDKLNNFYSINLLNSINKSSISYINNKISLYNKKILLNNFTGYSEAIHNIQIKKLDSLSTSKIIIEILTNIPHGFTIEFYDDNNYIEEITADSNLLNYGLNEDLFFNPNGTTYNIAKSMALAINSIDQSINKLHATSYKNYVIVESLFKGSYFNKLNYKLKNIINASYYVSILSNNLYFYGGSDNTNYRYAIKKVDINKITNNYIKLKNGSYIINNNYLLYLDEPVYNKNRLINYNNFDTYYILTFTEEPFINTFSEITLHKQILVDFGRLSIYSIKDFDTDMYNTEYINNDELDYEELEYTTNSNKNIHPDIIEFNKTGFNNIENLINNNIIENEYDRLNEKYIYDIANISKTVPYINKWVYKNGINIREKEYRLNLSDSFGIYNFSPSKDEALANPFAFTHEWYYLYNIPDYFSEDAIKVSWSYFDVLFTEDDLKNINEDKFTDIFIVDRININNTYIPINKQYRYSTFSNNSNTLMYSYTFFRGVKIEILERAEYNTIINYNLQNLEFVKSNKYNDYKFTSVVIVNDNTKSNFNIKVIENAKWKTITLLIYINIQYELFNNNSNFIDRTILYALKNKFDNIENRIYSDKYMQGAINLLTSTYDVLKNEYTIRGINDINDIPTDFINDITKDINNNYNYIEFKVNFDTYIISNITEIKSKSEFIAKSFTKNGILVSLPIYNPTLTQMRSLNNNIGSFTDGYLIKNGGYNIFTNLINNISFNNIYNYINNGNPNIIYETINIDGTITNNTFIIKFIEPELIVKPIYLNSAIDNNRPVVFNLVDVIGYKLVTLEQMYLKPIYRYSGDYEPKFYNIINFEDPYLTLNILNDYQQKVFDLVRYQQTAFKLDTNFGIIKNLFYHKTNLSNFNNILELTNDKTYQSKYPLINETGIAKKDFYIFNSNWDPGYYIKHDNKEVYTLVRGTRSMTEHKSFFGSKILKLPQEILLETFDINNITINYNLSKSDNLVNNVITYEQLISIQIDYINELINYLYNKLYNLFNNYVNPLYGYGNQNSIDTSIYEYINKNILPQYKINKIYLYIKSEIIEENKIDIDLEYINKSNTKKLLNNLNIDNNFKIDYNILNQYFIINKKLKNNYKYYIGISINILKK